MKTASRWLIALGLVAAATATNISEPTRAAAQDVQVTGPLKGQPAVRKMRIYRKGRFQLQPQFGATLVDEFSRTLFVGAQIGYHFTDWLGIHAFFDYGGIADLNTDLTKQVETTGQRTDNNALSLPDPRKFSEQIGRIQFLTGAQLTFIPLRGKLALFQAGFVDTDFYLFGGVAAASVSERTDVRGGGACTAEALRRARERGNFGEVDSECLRTQTAQTARIAIAPTFGVGLSMYFTDYFALTFEWRAFPFKWNTSGTDEGGLNKERQPDGAGAFPDGAIDAADRTRQFNQMFRLGFAFYMPFQGEITD